MSSRYILQILCIALAASLWVGGNVLYAQSDPGVVDGAVGNLINAGEAAGIDPQDANTSLTTYVARIVQRIIVFVGVLFMALVVTGGIMWMTAGGSEERVASGQRLIRNAIIGLGITITAYLITRLVMTIFFEAASTTFVPT